MATAGKGRWRLTVLLCGLSGFSCALAMLAVLLLYGLPYDALWWWIMGGILAAAFVLPRALVFAIEWVIAGYREQSSD